MRLRPLDFFLLIYAAIRDRRLERELDDEVWNELIVDGFANPDGTLNVEALRADAIPLEEAVRAWEENAAQMAD